MKNDVREKSSQIGKRILTNARNELYISMRFLDVALSSLGYEMNLNTFFVGTEGVNIYFNPRFLMERFDFKPALVNRAYLHMVLHCIFRHMYEAKNRDEEIWNTACDIAVEYIIDSLDYKCVKQVVKEYRKEIYEQLEKKLTVLNAEGIYHVLKNEQIQYSDFIKVAAEFLVDDHMFWTAKKKDGPKEQNNDSKEDSNEGNSSNQEQSNQEKSKQNKDNQRKSDQDNQDSDDQKPSQKDLDRKQSQKNELEDRLNQEKNREQQKKWEKINEKMKTNLETFSRNIGLEAGHLLKALDIDTHNHYDYRSFLSKFAVTKEVMQVDMDSFDYGFYNYGIETYGNIPLMEPLEYKETRRIEEFVIAIDTSASCSGSLITNFLEQTYEVLNSTESFFKKVNIRIIQCDMEIKEDTLIRSLEEFENYKKNFEAKGFGGTDFRPVFTYVDDLIKQGQLKQLKGMIYFTDGLGIYPKTRPAYDVAFLFLKDDYSDTEVPSWAMKMVLGSKDFDTR